MSTASSSHAAAPSTDVAAATRPPRKTFITLGMFIIDEFSYADEQGNTDPSRLAPPPQESFPSSAPIFIGGGGTYAIIGARIWLPPSSLSMIVDAGPDFPPDMMRDLQCYSKEHRMMKAHSSSISSSPSMFIFRTDPSRTTTRALNSYRGDHRAFEYLTPRLRITPKDFRPSSFSSDNSNSANITAEELGPEMMHFICSPTRAKAILDEAQLDLGWNFDSGLDGLASQDFKGTVTIYEPIPSRCVPEELPALKDILSYIHILSPNAEEALSLLSIPYPSSSSTETAPSSLKSLIESAAQQLLSFGMPSHGAVIIRSGELGAYVLSKKRGGVWVDAYWSQSTGEGEKEENNTVNENKVVDVTGAGNSFLGGLAAGMKLCAGDVYQAALYASVSASFVIEQLGLPVAPRVCAEREELWNGDSPRLRVGQLRARLADRFGS